MSFTSKSRLAIIALVDLAVHERLGAVTAGSIANRQKISLGYLEQLIARLRRAGLVTAYRGPGGGYSLTRDPADITAYEIVMAVDDIRLAGKPKGEGVQTNLWQGLDDHIQSFLESTTLASLVAQQPEPEASPRTAAKARGKSGYDLAVGIRKLPHAASVTLPPSGSGFALAQAWGGR